MVVPKSESRTGWTRAIPHASIESSRNSLPLVWRPLRDELVLGSHIFRYSGNQSEPLMSEQEAFHHIGLVGMIGSGRTTTSEYIQQSLGMVEIDLSDIVEEHLKNKGIRPSPKALHDASIELRRNDPAIVVRKAVNDWIPWIEDPRAISNPSALSFVFNGIRNREEVEFLRDSYGSDITVIGLWAPLKLRFERVRRGKRADFAGIRLDSFRRIDEEELRIFDVGNTITFADYLLVNDRTIEELQSSVRKILAQIRTSKLAQKV